MKGDGKLKVKIIIFVIGLLVGAIIASGAFLIYTKTSSTNCETQTTHMNGGTPPEMPSGENDQLPQMPNGENGQPPEKPDGENSNSSESSKKSKKSNSGSTTNSDSTEKSDSKTKESI